MAKFSSSLFAAIACLIVIIATTGCNNENIPSALYQAEAIMLDKPDSALNILQTIDAKSLRSEESRALHALLLSQAYHKNYIDITNDSLIMVAVNFYADSDDHFHRMLAHYLLGCIYENIMDYASCLIHCIEAEKQATLINDYFYLGLIYGTISNCYNKTYNFTEEREYALLSLKSFEETQKEPYLKYAYLSYGVSLSNDKKYNEADSLYQHLLSHPKYAHDSIFHKKITSNLIYLKWINEEYSEIIKILFLEKNKYVYDASSFAIIADTYREINQIDQAEAFLNRAKTAVKTTREEALVKQVEYYLMLQNYNYSDALSQLKSITNIQNQATQTIWSQAVMKRQRDYFKQKKEIADYQNERQNLIHLSVYIIISIIIVCSIFIIIYHNKKTKHIHRISLSKILGELNYKEDLIQKTKQRISTLEEKLTEEQSINKQFRNEIEIQEQILNLYEKQAQYEQIYKQIAEKQIENSSIIGLFKKAAQTNTTIKASEWEELEKYIDCQFPLFKQRLSELIKLSEIEHQVCMLVKCNFQPKEIGILVNRSIESISSIRRRLYKKIYLRDGKPSELDHLISSL